MKYFMKAPGAVIVHVGATVLHDFVYFSISKFLPKMQFTSATEEIWGHLNFVKMRQRHHTNLTSKRGGGPFNVKPRKTSLIKRHGNREEKHQLSWERLVQVA